MGKNVLNSRPQNLAFSSSFQTRTMDQLQTGNDANRERLVPMSLLQHLKEKKNLDTEVRGSQ
jgi:hypothetical protein